MKEIFAISDYPDAVKINRQLDMLIEKPIFTIKPEPLQRYLDQYFATRCRKSKALIDKAVDCIPGGVQHNLAFNYPFPLVFVKADGAFLYDIDENRYYDFLQAGGPTVLGSNPIEVREQVIQLLNECGSSTGLFHEYEFKLARKISEVMPAVEMFRMLNTVFGKVVAGGYPSAGGVGGRKEYMKYLSAGIQGGSKQKKALVGGTLAANPLSCVAGYHTICEIERTGAAGLAGQMGDRLTKGLQAIIMKYNLPFVAFNQGSIVHLETVGTMHFVIDWKRIWRIPKVMKETSRRKVEMERMGAAYMAEGLVTLAGSRLYTSAAYTGEMIDDALARFENVMASVAEKSG